MSDKLGRGMYKRHLNRRRNKAIVEAQRLAELARNVMDGLERDFNVMSDVRRLTTDSVELYVLLTKIEEAEELGYLTDGDHE